MHAVNTLLPVVLLIALGWALTKIRFLGEQFLTDLNKLSFWVALPAFIIRSISDVRIPFGETLRLFFLLLVCTIAAIFLGPIIALLLGARKASLGSVAQASFRGNLAFAGLPIITYSLADLPEEIRTNAIGTALLVFGPLTASYNFLAIFCLQRIENWRDPRSYLELARSIATNPLLISCLIGVFMAALNIRLPRPIDNAFAALGGVALPVALLCIGGAFVRIQLGGRYRSIFAAVSVKILFLPFMAWTGCELLNITGLDRRIVMIYAGVPTASTAYTMAREMGGDATVTSAAVAVSTILAFVSLTIILSISP
ncbi:MAG: AEC family transporter [Chthoniobacterales bacterium]|nr:AEC family transporter [Chthoniobacterales bacterium]